MLTFDTIVDHKPGIIASLLTQSYAELLSSGQEFWQLEKEKWIEFDGEVFANPDTIGRCVFLTHLDVEIIGFSSFDPRGGPAVGLIGHNCILPRFRWRGYGKVQIEETLRRMKARSITKAVATTSEHPFFIPAQRMYRACGFRQTGKYPGNSQLGFRIIEYQLDL